MASLKTVTWAASASSDWVDLAGLDIIGFWDKNDALSGTGLTIKTADNSAGTTASDVVVDYTDATAALTIDLDAGSHNYILISPSTFAGLQRYVQLVSSGAETGVAYLVVRDFR